MAVAKGQIVFHGVHLRKGTNEVVEPATYAAAWPALADGGKSDDAFQVDADYDFEAVEAVHVVDGAATGTHVKLQIMAQTENGRPWFIQPTYINAISSLQDSGRTRRFPVKIRVAATKKVKFNFYESTAL